MFLKPKNWLANAEKPTPSDKAAAPATKTTGMSAIPPAMRPIPLAISFPFHYPSLEKLIFQLRGTRSYS